MCCRRSLPRRLRGTVVWVGEGGGGSEGRGVHEVLQIQEGASENRQTEV